MTGFLRTARTAIVLLVTIVGVVKALPAERAGANPPGDRSLVRHENNLRL
jgi:hypothetical protein